MDRLTAMEIFARVAEAGSFSGAARQLALSKSAVSKHVMALEDRLGARLFNRTTRRVSVTEVGRAYYRWCQQIVAEVAEAELSVGRLQAEPRGTLKVNAPMSFGFLHLAPAIPDFLARYPEIEVDLTLTDRFVDLIEEGCDLAVRIGSPADSSLIARKLAPSRKVVCGAPGYFRRRGIPKTPQELAAHNCLNYSHLSPKEEWTLRGPDRTYVIEVGGNFRVNNGDALQAAVREGLGIALLPTFIVGEDLKAGRLQSVLNEFEPSETAIYAVYPHNRHLSPKVRSFVDFLAARFAPRPYWEAEARSEPGARGPAPSRGKGPAVQGTSGPQSTAKE